MLWFRAGSSVTKLANRRILNQGGSYATRTRSLPSQNRCFHSTVYHKCYKDTFPSFAINVFLRKASWTKSSYQMKESNQRIIAFALDTGSSGGEEINGDRNGLGSTRLGRIAIALGKQLLLKINSARKNFPMKIFLLLLGFYTANALATILGQTGDWDVLVAGIVVAAIEGIGMLMYKKKPSSSGKFQSFVVFMNFWKAGVCLGLFVDAFKLGS